MILVKTAFTAFAPLSTRTLPNLDRLPASSSARNQTEGQKRVREREREIGRERELASAAGKSLLKAKTKKMLALFWPKLNFLKPCIGAYSLFWWKKGDEKEREDV